MSAFNSLEPAVSMGLPVGKFPFPFLSSISFVFFEGGGEQIKK